MTPELTMDNEQTAQPRRLYKSRRDKMIDGVCGGIAEYFDIDATILRILWILTVVFGGTGIFLYIAAMIIMPVNPDHLSAEHRRELHRVPGSASRTWGIILVSVGLFILLANIGWFPFYKFWNISWGVVFPIMIILLGMALIYSQQQDRNREQNGMNEQTQNTSYKRLYKSRTDKKLFGVCGGLGNYFNVDPTMVRILYAALAIFSIGAGIVLYLAMALFVPNEPERPAQI